MIITNVNQGYGFISVHVELNSIIESFKLTINSFSIALNYSLKQANKCQSKY